MFDSKSSDLKVDLASRSMRKLVVQGIFLLQRKSTCVYVGRRYEPQWWMEVFCMRLWQPLLCGKVISVLSEVISSVGVCL